MTGFVHRRGDDVRSIKGTWRLCLFPCTSCPIEPGHNSENHFNYFQFNLTFTFIINFHHRWTLTSYRLSLNFGNSLSLSFNLDFPYYPGDRSVPGEPKQHPPPCCSPRPPPRPPLLCPLYRFHFHFLPIRTFPFYGHQPLLCPLQGPSLLRTRLVGCKSKICLGRFLETSTIHLAKIQCKLHQDLTLWSGEKWEYWR